MTDKAISPLRRRMTEDMTIRKFAPKTQASYIRAVRNFTVFLGRSPDQASAEHLRRYQLHLASRGIAAPSQNATVTALRFFFAVTLGRSEATDRMPFVQSRIDPGDPLDKNLYDLPAEELAKARSTPGSLDEALHALEADHEFLLDGDVFTKDVILTHLAYKRSREVDEIRLRPHPYELVLYYDI